MTTNDDPRNQPDAGKDALDHALARERTAGDGVPVKQHNPDDQGLNPGQKGPAQPSGTDATGSR